MWGKCREFRVAVPCDRQGRDAKSPGHQVVQATKFCTFVPNICGSLVQNLLHVTVLVPRILKRRLDFILKISAPLQ
jgi:hypothetical protein